jgi:hypothetical protein
MGEFNGFLYGSNEGAFKYYLWGVYPLFNSKYNKKFRKWGYWSIVHFKKLGGENI